MLHKLASRSSRDQHSDASWKRAREDTRDRHLELMSFKAKVRSAIATMQKQKNMVKFQRSATHDMDASADNASNLHWRHHGTVMPVLISHDHTSRTEITCWGTKNAFVTEGTVHFGVFLVPCDFSILCDRAG